METAMRVALSILLSGLVLVGRAAAEPPKVETAKPAQARQRPAEIVLASADAVRSPSSETVSPSPARTKRPAPRVTTCRCGDPQPEPDSEQQ
jgi:hypothetical protein